MEFNTHFYLVFVETLSQYPKYTIQAKYNFNTAACRLAS